VIVNCPLFGVALQATARAPNTTIELMPSWSISAGSGPFAEGHPISLPRQNSLWMMSFGLFPASCSLECGVPEGHRLAPPVRLLALDAPLRRYKTPLHYSPMRRINDGEAELHTRENLFG
jgi:hypothetical protein